MIVVRASPGSLKFVDVPTSMYNVNSTVDATGIYVNYLAMEGVLFLPIFKRRKDDRVIRLFEDLFPGTDIVPVDCRELARGGGLLNCISWNIRE